MQTRKHEAVSPFLQQKSIDPTTTLVYIKTEIASIYTAAKDSSNNDDEAFHISQDKYIELYTTVHNFCTTMVQRSKVQPGIASTEFRDLYQYLGSEIRAYCEYTRDHMLGVNNDEMDIDESSARKMLTTYLSQYRKFLKLASLARNLLGFWDRHWIRREWLEKKIQSASVEELHRTLWKEEVLEKKGLERVVDAVGVLRETQGGMTEYDLVLVRDIVKGLSGSGVTLES